MHAGKRLQDREMELRKMQDENSLLTQEVTRRLDDQEELLLQHQSAAQEVCGRLVFMKMVVGQNVCIGRSLLLISQLSN